MISRLYTLFFIAFFTGFILLSCSGKDKALLTPQDSLKEKKLLDSFSENIKYFPEKYSEMVTDTTLSNGFRVHIKTQTDMESSVLNEFKQDTIHFKYYFRNFTSNIEIFRNNQSSRKVIDKSLFSDKSEQDFWTKAILGPITVDFLNSTEEEVCFNVYFCIPESDVCKDYKLFLNEKGMERVEKIITPELP